MLNGTDLITNLTTAIGPAQVKIPVNSPGDLATRITATNGAWVYMTLDDGTQQEIVKITAATAAGELTIARGQFGTTASSFVAGVCLKPYIGINFICEMFSQGGCQTGSVVSCSPVSVATESLPDAVIGKPWVGVIAFNNATTISVLSKAPWMTQSITGSTLILKGSPPANAVPISLVVRADGCNNSISTINTHVQVCQQVSI